MTGYRKNFLAMPLKSVMIYIRNESPLALDNGLYVLDENESALNEGI